MQFRRGKAPINADVFFRIQHVNTEGKPLTVNHIDSAVKDLVLTEEETRQEPYFNNDDDDKYAEHLNNDKILSTVKQWIIENAIPSKRA